MDKEIDSGYIVNGKRYSPKTSLLLCKYKGVFYSESLYISQSGEYYTVRCSSIDETTVNILTKDEALKFMDEHPAGIIEENYIGVFGVPQDG